MLTWNHVERSHGGKHLAQVLRNLCRLVSVTHDLQQVLVANEVEPAERLHRRHDTDRQTGAVRAGFGQRTRDRSGNRICGARSDSLCFCVAQTKRLRPYMYIQARPLLAIDLAVCATNRKVQGDA